MESGRTAAGNKTLLVGYQKCNDTLLKLSTRKEKRLLRPAPSYIVTFLWSGPFFNITSLKHSLSEVLTYTVHLQSYQLFLIDQLLYICAGQLIMGRLERGGWECDNVFHNAGSTCVLLDCVSQQANKGSKGQSTNWVCGLTSDRILLIGHQITKHHWVQNMSSKIQNSVFRRRKYVDFGIKMLRRYLLEDVWPQSQIVLTKEDRMKPRKYISAVSLAY